MIYSRCGPLPTMRFLTVLSTNFENYLRQPNGTGTKPKQFNPDDLGNVCRLLSKPALAAGDAAAVFVACQTTPELHVCVDSQLRTINKAALSMQQTAVVQHTAVVNDNNKIRRIIRTKYSCCVAENINTHTHTRTALLLLVVQLQQFNSNDSCVIIRQCSLCACTVGHYNSGGIVCGEGKLILKHQYPPPPPNVRLKLLFLERRN